MGQSLAGKRILVVEDEYFIATAISRTLKGEGAVVVGPVGNLARALTLVEEPIDAAVLDVNLEEAMSFPVADRLHDRRVPYMFLTGYDGWAMPAEYRDAARLAKPFPPQAVVSMVRQIISVEQEPV